MSKKTESLLTVANYARQKQVTPQAVYQWIEAGRVTLVEVDGVKFIKVNGKNE